MGWMMVKGATTGILILLASTACVGAEPPTRPPSLELIVARMAGALAESRSHLRPYKVVRNYKLYGNEEEKVKSEVNAQITFIPPDKEHYVVHKAQGLGLGESIVRRMLESETEILLDESASDISEANYAFHFIRQDTFNDRPCFVLKLDPLRKDMKLLRGMTWVDAATYLIQRIEGEPAKSPSWWVRDVHIILEFHDVGGMWLQDALRSTARVRFLGQHSIISRDVDYDYGMDVTITADPRQGSGKLTLIDGAGVVSPASAR